jgi:hypothetical protein
MVAQVRFLLLVAPFQVHLRGDGGMGACASPVALQWRGDLNAFVRIAVEASTGRPAVDGNMEVCLARVPWTLFRQVLSRYAQCGASQQQRRALGGNRSTAVGDAED